MVVGGWSDESLPGSCQEADGFAASPSSEATPQTALHFVLLALLRRVTRLTPPLLTTAGHWVHQSLPGACRRLQGVVVGG